MALDLVLANVASKEFRDAYAMTGPPNLATALQAFRLLKPEADAEVRIITFKEGWDRLWEKVDGSFNKDGMHWSLREKSEPLLRDDIELVDVLEQSDIFTAYPGRIVGIDRIVSRQGFHPYEPNGGFSWVAAGESSFIRFEALVPFDGLRIRMFRMIDIPLSSVHFTINDDLLDVAQHMNDEQWGVLDLGPLRIRRGENVLTIVCEQFLPANTRNLESIDSRQLSIAIAWLQPYLRR
jgi:hypothetical protein